MTNADIVVIGLGAIGSATLYQLAKRGVRVIGIDRFSPPHDRGSTHGETRLTRLATAEGAAYVPLAFRSREIWRELEALTGETLLTETGGLIIAQGDGGFSHGQPGFLGRTIQIARDHAIAHELLDSAEIRHRYQQFRVTEEERGYFEPTIGVLYPERAVRIQLRLARQHGATLRLNERMLSLQPSATGVTVMTENGRIEAAKAVLASGPWLPGMTGGALGRVATIQRQTLLWFEPDEPALYDPACCPIFLWQHGAGPEDYLYGFPLLPGSPGIKAGTERYSGGIDPDHVERDVPEQEWRGIYHRHIAGRLRGVSDRLVKSTTCLYTVLPDAHFLLDQQTDERVIAISACSGHGFKHSPALGEAIAKLALNEASLHPSFAAARFANAAP